MEKLERKKIMPILVALTMIFSVSLIVPKTTADPFIGVFPDGIIWKATALTCGDECVYRVTTETLDPETDYILQINNTVEWLDLESGESDKDGNLFIEFNAPGWANLNGTDPIGTWTLRLADEDGIEVPGYGAEITITNLYHINLKYNGNWIDNLVYNNSYAPIYMYIYNWSGSRYEIADDKDFYTTLKLPDGSGNIAESEDVITNGIWDFDLSSGDMDFRDGVGNLECYLPVTVYDGIHTTITAVPVLLAVTASYPNNTVWGDSMTITGYVKDGKGKGIGGYGVALYGPVDGGYVQMETATTYSTGRYSMTVDTGYDNGYVSDGNAGTWYIGTLGIDPYRVDESDKFEHPIDLASGFVRYYMFDVKPDTDVDIEIESPDEITDAFKQTINISCEWNGEPFNNHDDDADSIEGEAAVHVTGIDCYFAGTEYDEEDIVYVGSTQIDPANVDKYSYCVFDIIFNKTGTGKIIVTHPTNNIDLERAMYNNSDLDHNIMGTLDFQVGTAADMNMVVTGEPEYVDVIVDPIDNDCWINNSATWIVGLDIYGDEPDKLMYASINVTGCGLDFTIDEDEEVGDNDYLLYKAEGYYEILISPKTGGTLTITATNSTDDLTVTKDFKVDGLKGSVKTSKGDDQEISVETSETITATIQGGDYAQVVVSYYNTNWDIIDCAIFDVEGDGETQGEGLNGVYEFDVEGDDIDQVGYLVVAAEAAGLYMYEIIEVAPIHDLEIKLTKPTNWTNKVFTVGLNHEDFEFKVYGPDDNLIDDIDELYAELLDEDDDVLQTIAFKERSGSIWVPDDNLMPWFTGKLKLTAINNSGLNEHDGEITFNVEYATITYSPASVTAGIDLENITVEIAGVDANGDPLPEGTTLYLHLENETGDLELSDIDITLDEEGMGDFKVTCTGDLKTWVNATLDNNLWEDGNLTAGNLTIDWPVFTVVPDIIYIGQPNTITITAKDYLGKPIEGLNVTIWPSFRSSFGVPDPVATDASGNAVFSISPDASGKANVTIVRDIVFTDGLMDWDLSESIVTDTYLTITALQQLQLSASKSPIYQGETLTVTVLSGVDPVKDVNIKFGTLSGKTDVNGKVDFTAPDPGVESATYNIQAEKTGYYPASMTISVIKKYSISIDVPDEVFAGQSFTVTIIAKGQPLAGATVKLDGTTTKMSGGDGKVTFTAGAKGATHTITASFEPYTSGQATVGPVKEKGIPGFELLTLVIAIGVAFILLRRRKQN